MRTRFHAAGDAVGAHVGGLTVDAQESRRRNRHTVVRHLQTVPGTQRCVGHSLLVIGMDDSEEQRERERARLYARKLLEKEAQRQSIEHQQRWQETRAMLEAEAARHVAPSGDGERQVREQRKEQTQRLRQWRASARAASTATRAQGHGSTPDSTSLTPRRHWLERSTSPERREAHSPPRAYRERNAAVLASPNSSSPSRLPLEPGAERPPLPRASDVDAAVVIQAGARGYATRRALTPERERRNQAATALQAAVRGERSRRKLAATVKLQSAFRGWRSREQYYDTLDRIVASEQIQAAFRGWQVRSALVAEAEALMGCESLRERHTAQSHPKFQCPQRVGALGDAESEAQVALERVRQGLFPRGPEDVADALAAITVLEERLTELSLQYDRSL